MVQALLNEVESCHSFFSSRAPNDPGNAILKKNFANSLIQQINQHISLNKADATQLAEVFISQVQQDQLHKKARLRDLIVVKCSLVVDPANAQSTHVFFMRLVQYE